MCCRTQAPAGECQDIERQRLLGHDSDTVLRRDLDLVHTYVSRRRSALDGQGAAGEALWGQVAVVQVRRQPSP